MKWVLAHQNEMGLDVTARESLTRALVYRQVFAEHPNIAAAYISSASRNPDGFLYEETWFDSAGTKAWLAAAMASTSDPKQREKVVLQFVAVYQQTRPEVPTPMEILHDALDYISFVDPFQIADGLNTIIYTAEGDYTGASLSAAGMLLPIGGGKVLKLGKEAIGGLLLKEGDEAAEAIIKAIADGTFTKAMRDEAVEAVAKELGPDVARTFANNLDELAEKAATAAAKPMIGENGTQIVSKTLTPPGKTYRIDVENPAPGVRPGQLHLQDANGGKYLYNFDTDSFEGIPGSLAKEIAKDPSVARAIAKGRSALGM